MNFTEDCSKEFTYNMQVLVQMIAWHRTGDKPLPELEMSQFDDEYMCHQAVMPNNAQYYDLLLLRSYRKLRASAINAFRIKGDDARGVLCKTFIYKNAQALYNVFDFMFYKVKCVWHIMARGRHIAAKSYPNIASGNSLLPEPILTSY